LQPRQLGTLRFSDFEELRKLGVELVAADPDGEGRIVEFVEGRNFAKVVRELTPSFNAGEIGQAEEWMGCMVYQRILLIVSGFLEGLDVGKVKREDLMMDRRRSFYLPSGHACEVLRMVSGGEKGGMSMDRLAVVIKDTLDEMYSEVNIQVSEQVVSLLQAVLLVDEALELAFMQGLVLGKNADWTRSFRQRLVNKMYLQSPVLGI
jgi:hypothetical protein